MQHEKKNLTQELQFCSIWDSLDQQLFCKFLDFAKVEKTVKTKIFRPSLTILRGKWAGIIMVRILSAIICF